MNTIAKHADLLKRFPNFELSYETVSHKKVSNAPMSHLRNSTINAVAIAVPLGRKYFIWHTYAGSEDVCYLLGLDKNKRVCSVDNYENGMQMSIEHSLGTIVYGTIYEEKESTGIFVAEDIYYYCGTNLSKLCFGDRVGFLRDYIKTQPSLALPVMWFSKEYANMIPTEIAKKMGYTAHHIQYREIARVAPYINVAIPKRGAEPSVKVSSAEVAQKITATSMMNPVPRFDYSKPAYRYPAVFNVTADSQSDLYHLYAYKQNNPPVYCGLAGVQSLKTSMFMNRLFRRIRENENLDLAEESEDEADFENTDSNKYVNLDTILQIECVFNQKHKKWIPVRLSRDRVDAPESRLSKISDSKSVNPIVHIDKLVADNERPGNGKYMHIKYRK